MFECVGESMPTETSGFRPALGTELRAFAAARIVQGALAALARQGLDATVDDVAAEAGVSRRTVFRHFATQGELFCAAIDEVYRIYDQSLPEPPDAHVSLESWLRQVVGTYHELNARFVGRAFWDIHVGRSGIAPEVGAALEDITARRFEWSKEIAGHAWRKAGGKGRTPGWVTDAFALSLSAYASHAMAKDSPEAVGRACTQILLAVLAAALRR